MKKQTRAYRAICRYVNRYELRSDINYLFDSAGKIKTVDFKKSCVVGSRFVKSKIQHVLYENKRYNAFNRRYFNQPIFKLTQT